MEPRSESRRLERRRGCGGCGGLWPASSGHRHRRLGAAAGRLVRARRLQAQPRPGADRPCLSRPHRGPAHAHRGRRRPDDVGAVAAGLARRDEPSHAGPAVDGPRSRSRRPAHRPHAGYRRGHGARSGGRAGRHGRRPAVRGSRRERRDRSRHSHPRDARRPRRFLARPGLGRRLPPPAGPARKDPCPTSGRGRSRARHARLSRS